MVTTSPFQKSSRASSVAEAQSLVRRCAEPGRAGDNIKAAIRRASRRLDMPFSRTRDIWYGDARRIDAEEIDRLRRGAEDAELASALAGIQILEKILSSRFPDSDQVFANVTAALRALGCDPSAVELGR